MSFKILCSTHLIVNDQCHTRSRTIELICSMPISVQHHMMYADSNTAPTGSTHHRLLQVDRQASGLLRQCAVTSTSCVRSLSSAKACLCQVATAAVMIAHVLDRMSLRWSSATKERHKCHHARTRLLACGDAPVGVICSKLQ